MNNRIGRVVALLCLAFSSGCYTYTQADLPTLPADTYVRLYLTRKGLNSIPAGAVPNSSSSVYLNGRIQKQTPDSLLIAVPVSLSVTGNGAKDLAQNIYVPMSEVVSVDRRLFSPQRTVLAFVGGVGFVSVTVLGISSAGKTSDADKASANPE
jgi:hypothetical protein